MAPAAGIVTDVGDYILSGHTVLIDHGQGAVSAYFHLDTAVVSKGDVVRAGDRIGRVGATGLATGPHLHYGMYVHGKDVDPVAWRGHRGFVGEPAALCALVGQLRAHRLGIAPPERPIGLLTHHLVTDGPTEAFVEHLIAVTAAHRAARWAAVTELLR